LSEEFSYIPTTRISDFPFTLPLDLDPEGLIKYIGGDEI
jgi:hypothetical protein